MKLEKPKNINYCATVVEIKTLVPLEGCDNVQAAIIMGNQVIVDKTTQIGSIGLFFPVECQLSKNFLSTNNLYRTATLNADPTKKGYFEEKGRVKCAKFRGHKSEGFYIPLKSVLFTSVHLDNLHVGDTFDELFGIEICKKYTIKTRASGMRNINGKKTAKETKILENQFRFHDDTSMLYKNLSKINPFSLIHVSYKIHGTSAIVSKLLCKKPLKWYEKILKKLGVNVVDTHYDYVYASRKVIKSETEEEGFYNDNIWKTGFEELKDFLEDGMTIYYEIAGYLKTGAPIQSKYDYGCSPGEHKIFVYRITYTNPFGKVYEFSAPQVQKWCKARGLTPVLELFYGQADNIVSRNKAETDEEWENLFLEEIKKRYNEKDCYICKNKVPEEGCVIRIEGGQFEAYKQKSTRFYELETKLLDKGEADIEEEN